MMLDETTSFLSGFTVAAGALDGLVLWLLTYALHSTLLLGSAVLLARAFPAAAERLWRIAVFGGLVTATLHAGGHLPRIAHIGIPGLPAAAIERTAPPVGPVRVDDRGIAAPSLAAGAPRDATARAGSASGGSLELEPAARRPGQSSARSSAARPGSSSVALVSALGSTSPPATATESERPAGDGTAAAHDAPPRAGRSAFLWRSAAAAWLLAVAASSAALACRTARFRLRLLARRVLADGEAPRLLHELVKRAGFRRDVRLTLTEAARVPMARGWARPEICLPVQVESELAAEELEAVLAHELAHLERRDPVWRAVTRVVAGALAFQPLNRLACRSLEDEAELRCDDRAAALTGRPAALARCLTRVAGWTADERPVALPALASNGSTLRRRVLRLLEGTARRPSPWWTHLVAIAPVTAVLLLAPGIGAAPPPDPPAPSRAPGAAPSPPGPPVAGPRAVAPVAPAPVVDAAPVVHRLTLPVFAPLEPAIAPEPPEAPTVPVAPSSPVAMLAPLAPIAPSSPPPALAPPAPLAPSSPPPALAPLAPIAPSSPAPALAPAPLPRIPAAAEPAPRREAWPQIESGDHVEDPVAAAEAEAEAEAEAGEAEAEAEVKAEAEAEARLEALHAELQEILEIVEEELEIALESAEEELEQELELIEEVIDGQADAFEVEIESALEPLEDALDALADEHGEALERGDEEHAGEIAGQMSVLAEAMGDLGGRIGELVGASALGEIAVHVGELVAVHGEALEGLALAHGEIAQRLAGELEERQHRGQPLEDDEVRALREELRRAVEESAPQREELERRIEELGAKLTPTREQVKALEEEMRREVDDWRRRHESLLRGLEEGGLFGPDDDRDAEPDPDPRDVDSDDPDPHPRPDPGADFAWRVRAAGGASPRWA